MATIPITVPSGEVPPDLQAAIDDLRGLGHDVILVPADQAPPSGDPFAGMALDEIPEIVLTNMGISREELRRHRNAPPAHVHGGGHRVAAPAEAGQA